MPFTYSYPWKETKARVHKSAVAILRRLRKQRANEQSKPENRKIAEEACGSHRYSKWPWRWLEDRTKIERDHTIHAAKLDTKRTSIVWGSCQGRAGPRWDLNTTAKRLTTTRKQWQATTNRRKTGNKNDAKRQENDENTARETMTVDKHNDEKRQELQETKWFTI